MVGKSEFRQIWSRTDWDLFLTTRINIPTYPKSWEKSLKATRDISNFSTSRSELIKLNLKMKY